MSREREEDGGIERAGIGRKRDRTAHRMLGRNEKLIKVNYKTKSECVLDSNYLVQDRDQWRLFPDILIILRVPKWCRIS